MAADMVLYAYGAETTYTSAFSSFLAHLASLGVPEA